MDSDAPIADWTVTTNRAEQAAIEGIVDNISLPNPARSHPTFNRSGSDSTFGLCSFGVPLFIVDGSSIQHVTGDTSIPTTTHCDQ
ncbi:hypothetical protein ACLOJK_018726 [Asimina triloba]